MLTVIAQYQAQVNRADEIAAVLADHQTASRAEPGCVRFDVYRGLDDPERFVLVEQYVDEAAFAAHRQSQHFRDNIDRRVALWLAERAWSRHTTI